MYIACLVVVVLKVQLHRERNKLGLSQSRRTFGTRAQMALGETSLAHVIRFCPNSVSIPLPDRCLYAVKYMRTCTHI